MFQTSFERYIRQGDHSTTPSGQRTGQNKSFLNSYDDDNLSRKNSSKNLHSKITNFVGPHFFNNTNFLHSFTKTFETVISHQQSLTQIVLEITKLFEKISYPPPSNTPTSVPKTLNKRFSAQSYLDNNQATPVNNNVLKAEIGSLTASLKKLLEQIPSIQKEASYNLDKSFVSQSRKHSPKSISQSQSQSQNQTPKKRPASSAAVKSTQPTRSVTSQKKTESTKKSRLQLTRENSQEHSISLRPTASSTKAREQYRKFPFSHTSKENSNTKNKSSQKKLSRNYTLQEILNKQEMVLNFLEEDKTEFEPESRQLPTLQTVEKETETDENKKKTLAQKNTRKSLLMVPKKEVEEEEGASPSQTFELEDYSAVKQILGDYDFPINAIPTEERLQERSIIKDMLRMEENAKHLMPHNSNKNHPIKKYLIDAKWWRAWKEHVNFDGKEARDYGRSSPLYQRPGAISNITLIKQECLLLDVEGGYQLKENLLEHHDFEAFSEEIFKTLAGWYGCDFEIPKMLRVDPSQPNQVFLDLYPNKYAKRMKVLR